MTKIESKHVAVNASVLNTIQFVSDLRNFEKLLPTEKIADFKADEKSCSFKVQGTVVISLELVEVLANEVKLKSGNQAPFKFDLSVFVQDKAEGTEVFQICKADINPFLKMMFEKPLTNLFDFIADKLTEELV
jgi:carbon monoxide dehydrogenase subunit G